MDGSAPVLDPFAELDKIAVPASWHPDLSATLLAVGATIGPIDRPILRPLVAFLARHSTYLREQASIRAQVEQPRGVHDAHPGSATLFRYGDRTSVVKGTGVSGRLTLGG